MKIQQVNNYYQNYRNSTPKQQQSFGAIKGRNFDEVINVIIQKSIKCHNDPNALGRFTAKQIELAKTGEDFASKFDRLVIINSKGEEIHPIVDLHMILYGNDPEHLEIPIVGDASERTRYGLSQFYASCNDLIDIDKLFALIQKTAKSTAEAMALPLQNLKCVLGIKPPPKPLAEAVLSDFATLSGIPEEQAKLLLPELIKRGQITTERELLEIAQGAGCLSPALTKNDLHDIAEEVELPPIDADIEVLKKFLGAA